VSLTGKPPAPGFYCPVCGDVRRVRGIAGREARVVKGTDEVIVFSHTRAPMTPLQTLCPGGQAHRLADRAP